METVLVVVRPFAGRAVGDVIDDPKQMQALLGGEYAMALVRVARRSEDAAASTAVAKIEAAKTGAVETAAANTEHAEPAATERTEG